MRPLHLLPVLAIAVAGLAACDPKTDFPAIVALATPPSGPAPSWRLKDPDGNLVSSDQFKGKVVVLDFWATWCAPCRASLPHLDELSKRYEGRVHFVAVNAQSEDVAAQSETRDMLKLKMPIATDGYDAASLYHVEKLPTTVILDSRGHVARTFEGPAAPETIAKALDALL